VSDVSGGKCVRIRLFEDFAQKAAKGREGGDGDRPVNGGWKKGGRGEFEMVFSGCVCCA
jgi:hypothetical protein